MTLLHQLHNGQKRTISEDDYEYFLEVLPPVMMRFPWGGERWDFGFAEGYDYVYAFKKQGDQFFAQKTDILNPREERDPTNKTAPGLIVKWLEIGKKNPWIRHAVDPPFNTQSFHRCQSDDELFDKFAHGNWCLGQAFYIGDLCFIQQVNGGDKWLTIKQDVPFESISFGHILRDQGRQGAQAVLDRIRAASVERCRVLDY